MSRHIVFETGQTHRLQRQTNIFTSLAQEDQKLLTFNVKFLMFLTSLMLERRDLDTGFVGNNGSRRGNSSTSRLLGIR